MKIAGLTKMSLLDYPGKISCVVFTQGCNFRCRFCHNPEILDLRTRVSQKLEKEFWDFLERRKGKLDAVVITGGEPTLHQDLRGFILKIKEKGFLVKLDSNGTNPGILKDFIDEGIVDYIAMDIKHTYEKYHLATGVKYDLTKIRQSIALLMQNKVDYEFRTTVVPGIHSLSDFNDILKMIKGAKKYFLQEFRNSNTFDKTLSKKPVTTISLEEILSLVQEGFEISGIRR